MEPAERWSPVAGWDGYEVSDAGSVRSWRNRGGVRRDSPLVLTRHMIHGHARVGLFAGGAKTMRLARVDKMVLEAFGRPCPPDADFACGGKVIHIDGDEWNCGLDNLRWKEPVRVPTEADIKGNDERWLPIEGWPGYEVSDWGRVGSRVRGRFKILKPWIGKENGYLYVGLVKDDGTKQKFLVHRLVLEAFVGPCPPGLEACHDPDKTRTNCRLDNLKWGDHFENMAHAIQHGSITPRAPKPEPEPILFFDPFIPVEALMQREVWKGIPGHEGYEASNRGEVRSYKNGNSSRLLDRPRILIGGVDDEGRRSISLVNDRGEEKVHPLHRIVYTTFSPPPAPGLVCRHIDGDCEHNHISNCRWGTTLENVRDKFHHGTVLRGADHPNAKLTPEKVREIRRRRKAGETRKDLAAEFGVHKHYVKLVEEGRRWGWIKDDSDEPIAQTP